MTSTTVDALKNLYIAMGGEAAAVADLNVIPDVINAIAELGAIKASGALSVNELGDVKISSTNKLLLHSNDDIVIRADNALGLTAVGSELQLRSTSGIYANDKEVVTQD